MNKIELEYSPYQINLKTPFETSKGRISERKGFIIRIKSESGMTGTGDASPFTEFGSESYDEIEAALNEIELKLEVDIDDIKRSLKYNLKNFTAYPALRHGLEQALINLICKEKQISLKDLLDLKLKKEINVNAAIGFLYLEDAAKKAKSLITEGFTTLKIKVGRTNFEDDLEVLRAVRNEIGENVKIRIDVNGKWDLAGAIRYLGLLQDLMIEYAEQPVNSLEDFIELKKATQIKLAADESIRNFTTARTFILGKAVDVIVLKPMLIGGLIPTLEIIELAENHDIIPVVTSSFESSIGRSNSVIAAACIGADISHGLAVSQHYEEDIAEDKFPVKNGKISLY